MNRRTFNALVSLGGMGSLGKKLGLDMAQIAPGDSEESPVKWPTETYRRLLVDTHVPDWDGLLAKFDPDDYVGTIARAGFQALMQYANSHVGLCLWQTKIGQVHAGMKGRDYFGEVMKGCRRRGLHRLAYYSVVFDDWAFQTHPDWRILPEDGYDRVLFNRLGTVCPNSPYRDHALACLRELVSNYDFEAIFIDMTFWPAVCYCPHCTARFGSEYHHEPPRVVNWNDPVWKSFQKAREQWMLEFARTITRAVKQVRPIPVYHQFGSAFVPWRFGVSLEQRDASDFCAGDFNGEPAKLSFICKTFWGLTPSRPFEFMTSRTEGLNDFETTKPIETLTVETFFPAIHSSACLLIDAIKPEGTLNHQAYEYMGEVNARHSPYEPFLGGEMLADVAVYYDKGSMFDPEENGLRVAEAASLEIFGGPGKNAFQPPYRKDPPHMKAALGATRILRAAHIPFGVVTNVTLDQLRNYRAVMLPSVLALTEEQGEQAEKFRDFVRKGGVLYVSGPSSLDQLDEVSSRLIDVLGVRYLQPVGSVTTYLTPTDSELQKIVWPQQNVTYPGRAIQSQALPGAEVLATVTLPYPESESGFAIGTRFTQIWSNPPADIPGRDPGIVVNSYGKGKAIWLAAPIESQTEAVYARLVVHLIRRYLPGPYHFEVDTHPAVEMTLFHQPDKHRLLVGLLNAQVQTPLIPVAAVVRVLLPADCRPRRVQYLPDLKEIPFEKAGPYVQFQVSAFKVVAMALVEYQ